MNSGDVIVGAFERLAAQRARAVIVASASRRATFGQVDSLSRSIAERLALERPAPGGLMGLAAPNGPAFLAGFLGLRRAGQGVLLLDPLAPSEDRRRALSVLGATAVLECPTSWPSSAADFRLQCLGEGRTVGPDVAVVKLTSGSTGFPRGVAMSAETMRADEVALSRTMGLRDEDRLLAVIPMSHSYGFTTLVLSALVRGVLLVLPADQSPFAPFVAAHELEATVFPTVPAWLQGVLRMSQPPAWPDAIRLVISAGAILPSPTAAQFRETYGQPVHVLYGSSECGGICYDRDGGAAERGTVGTAVEGVRVSLKPLDDEGEGIVTVTSAAVAETYLPEPDPRLGAGCFETSDVGTWCGGELALRRRVDRVINVRGRKVDPAEVEIVLAALQGVVEAVVIGVASADRRDEIVRAVVACPSGKLGYEDVAAWCRLRLADYKVPRSVVIVDAIPRTARGKVDRSALLALRSAAADPGAVHG